jgi:hypothetical protein
MLPETAKAQDEIPALFRFNIWNSEEVFSFSILKINSLSNTFKTVISLFNNKKSPFSLEICKKNGLFKNELGRIRTFDSRLKRAILYR